MTNPVWSLSVDLQTKTATFQSGMADAAKQARAAFGDIADGAKEASESTSYSMMEARHGVMLLGEEFGVHLPRGITSFLASLGPVGAVMEAAFPFLAIALGATLLLEHLSKLREEAEKLSEDQLRFGTVIENVFNGLDQKLLQAGIRVDELRGNHLAALKKELQLIDLQSMADLVHQLDVVAKAADVTFADIQSHWYTFGAGSDGAKHALSLFQAQYASLIAQGKQGDASNLLQGTKETAEQTLALMEQMRNPHTGNAGPGDDVARFNQARQALLQIGAIKENITSLTENDIAAQRTLIDTLTAQVGEEEKIKTLDATEKQGAKLGEDKKMGKDADQLARAQAEGFKRGQEIEQQQWEEHYRAALGALETNEKEKMQATEQGSAERLAAIDSALREEEKYGLQETSFYRSLLTERVQVTRQMTDEQNKIEEEAGREDARHVQAMGELTLAAEKDSYNQRIRGLQLSDEARAQMEIAFETRDYQLKSAAFARDIDALDKYGKDYQNKLKALQDKQIELTQSYENKVTSIQTKAEEDRVTRILASENHFNDTLASGLTSMVMRHQTAAQMIISLGDQVVSGMIDNAIKSILADDMTKERDAAKAARKAFNAGMELPFPINIVAAPTFAAAAFASVMAFEQGGIVPGMGTAARGDVVPAVLSPGEAVLTKDLTDGLTRAAQTGNLGRNAPTVHVHHSPTYHVHAIDGASVRGMLKKHSQEFTSHFHAEVRKLNR